jgi:hypothetical protein
MFDNLTLGAAKRTAQTGMTRPGITEVERPILPPSGGGLYARLAHREVVGERYQEDLTLHDAATRHLDAYRLLRTGRTDLRLEDVTLR